MTSRTGRESNPNRDPNRKARNLISCLRPEQWLLEISSFLRTFASFVMLLTVFIYDREPDPRWITRNTLNVVMSVLSTIFRISIMIPVGNCLSQAVWIAVGNDARPLDDIIYFDSASRGPLGILKLIHRFKAQYDIVFMCSNILTLLLTHLHIRQFVCLGAFVTVLVIGLGPFFQRAVEYRPLQAEDPTL